LWGSRLRIQCCLSATAHIGSLAQELPYAMGAAKETKTKTKQNPKKSSPKPNQ